LPLASRYRNPLFGVPFRSHHFARRPFAIISRIFAGSKIGFAFGILVMDDIYITIAVR
jgi:hypothetical protein